MATAAIQGSLEGPSGGITSTELDDGNPKIPVSTLFLRPEGSGYILSAVYDGPDRDDIAV